MPRVVRALTLVVLAAIPATALGFPVGLPWTDEPLRIDVTESLYFDWHGDNGDDASDNDDYFDVRNRLNLDFSLGDYTLGARFDTAWFPAPVSDAYQNDWFRPEKVYLRIQKEHVSITVGDFYAVFGRGLSLYFRKVDELSFDPTLRGAFVEYRDGWFHLTALGGLVNDLNVDDRNEYLVDDPNDLVLGLRAEVDPAPWLAVGGHAVMVLNRKDFPPEGSVAPQQRVVAGATVEVPDLAGIFSFYGEFDAITRTDIRYDAAQEEGELPVPTYTEEGGPGYAGYASATATAFDVTALLEFRLYDRFDLLPTPGGSVSRDLRYIRPPTLERVRERNVVHLEDSTGLRARLDYALPSNTVVYANVMQLWDAPTEDGRTLHVYGGVTQRVDRWGLLADLSGGWRWEQKRDLATRDRVVLQDKFTMWHVDFDAVARVWGPHSLAVAVHHEQYDDEQFGGRTYHIGELDVTYSFAPWLDVAFVWGYTNEVEKRKEHYFGGDVRVRFKSDSFVRVFAGSRKGGLQCVNGLCRDEAPFEGVRTEVVVRF